MPWHGGDLLKKVLKGVDKATPASSIREQRSGVKRKWLVYLQEDLDMLVPKNKAVLATADTALYSQLQLGEILSDKKSIEKYNFTSLPAVKHFRDSPENKTKPLFLPKTKLEPLGVDVVVPAEQQHQPDKSNRRPHSSQQTRTQTPTLCIQRQERETGSTHEERIP